MANNQWEDTFSGNFKQHPILGALTAGIAPALATGFGKAANIMTYQPSPEQAKINQSQFEGYFQDRLGSGIGSSQGATRLGVPTPSGTAPIVSMNFGPETSKSMPVRPRYRGGDTTWEAALPQTQPVSRVQAPTSPIIKARNSGTKSKTPINTPLPTAPAMPQLVNAGYGAYADGSPIENFDNNPLMAGDTASTYDPMQNRLNLNYTPEQAKANHEQALALQTGVPMGAQDFRSDSQRAFDEKSIADIKNPPLDFSKMSMADLMAMKASLKQRASTSQANYQDTAANVLQGNFGLAQNKQPYDIAKVVSDIGTQESTAKIARDKAPLDMAKTEADINFTLKGQLPQAIANAEYLIANAGKVNEEKKWVGTEAASRALGHLGTAGGGGAGGATNATGIDFTDYAKTIAILQGNLPMLADDPVELKRTQDMIVNLNDIMKQNNPKGTIPSRGPVTPLPTLY